MARKKNSTFQGSTADRIMRDAATYKSAIENAAGDFALTSDLLSGDNLSVFDTTKVNHSGSFSGGDYRGCPLGVPYVMGVNMSDEALLNDYGTPSTFVDSDYVWTNTYAKASTKTVNVWMHPIYIPRGEPLLYVYLDANDQTTDPNSLSRRIKFDSILYDSSMVEVDSMRMNNGSGGQLFSSILRVPAAKQGTLCFFAIQSADFTSAVDGWFRPPVLLFRPRTVVAMKNNPMVPPSVSDSPFTVATQTQSGSGHTIPLFQDVDASLFADGIGLTGHHTSTLNTNINTMEEWLTGTPPGAQPTRAFNVSRYHSHSTDGGNRNDGPITNNVNIDFPIFTTCFGATEPDTKTGAVIADIGTNFSKWDTWRVKIANVAANWFETDALFVPLLFPQFRTPGGDTGTLHIALLAQSHKYMTAGGAADKWSASFGFQRSPSGTVIGGAGNNVDFVRVGTSSYYVAQREYATAASSSSHTNALWRGLFIRFRPGRAADGTSATLVKTGNRYMGLVGIAVYYKGAA